jgi:hypothetical protein
MKIFAALLVGCCLLGGGPARAEKIDFSKTTCKQFFDTHKGDVGAKKFSAYCAAHPAASLTMAADEVFAE